MALIVGKVTFGQGRPKICVPLTGHSRTQLIEQAQQLADLPADLAEWRADLYREDRMAVLPELRKAVGERLLLVTLRTAAEGGGGTPTREEYSAFCRAVAGSGCADLVDVELRWGEDVLSVLLPQLRQAGIRVVLSSHDWEQTPESGLLLDRFQQMSAWGADLRKIAVMPHSPEDVLRLLRVTRKAALEDPDRPVISMAMGPLGAVSRVCGEVFGSAVTFGAGERSSAPGQLPAQTLRICLDALRLEDFSEER